MEIFLRRLAALLLALIGALFARSGAPIERALAQFSAGELVLLFAIFALLALLFTALLAGALWLAWRRGRAQGAADSGRAKTT